MSKVFVGLSGGVDSAVSAALLKQQGHDVVGAFIKIWRPEFIDCPWRAERLDAMRVCAALAIPFREIDLSDEYKKSVIDEMVSNYARGITPNPDVLCNRHIKFGAFKNWAQKEGAELIATGHYARAAGISGDPALLRGIDVAKDQSYFLAQLTRNDLRDVCFPVGELPKARVRELAKEFGLPVASKPDSQGLCFVGDISMSGFLSHYLPLEKGSVLNESGDTIGEHDGAALYTLGKRHGFRVHTDSPTSSAQYVIGIDVAANTITVSPTVEPAYVTDVVLQDVNWLIEVPELQLNCEGQARYHEKPVHCTAMVKGKQVHIAFAEPHLAPPGQTLALYQEDRLVASGVVE